MISVIIPAYNEAAHIAVTIQQLRLHDEAGLVKEIIVADGGSRDDTVGIAAAQEAIAVVSPKKGRSAQMNYGASIATEQILYFLHADTIPPRGFSTEILQALQQGFEAGCYRLCFDHAHWFLAANCWFTRFDVNAFRFGDQSLFVTRKSFERINGFCEKHLVLEDQHIVRRLKKQGRFKVLDKEVITSSRKYLENGIYKTQGIFFIIYFMYKFGYRQQTLVSTYKRLITQDKL